MTIIDFRFADLELGRNLRERLAGRVLLHDLDLSRVVVLVAG